MNLSIQQWDIDKAAQLHTIWHKATANAPFAYAVEPEEFATGMIPVESDDESFVTSHPQKLFVASNATEPVGFVHIAADSNIEVNGEDIECGMIRCLAFSPDQREVGQTLLNHAEQTFRAEGFTHADAFPLYHGYPFHNHKVGILSDRMPHVSSLLIEAGYKAHDGHLTMERSLDSAPMPDPYPGVDVIIEKTDGAGIRPNIWVRATINNEVIGNCRSQSGCTYATHPSLETLSYTRGMGIKEPHRRKGIGRYLLKHALHEMRCEGYQTAALNCREKNHPAVSLYKSEGYATADTSFAYVKDLNM